MSDPCYPPGTRYLTTSPCGPTCRFAAAPISASSASVSSSPAFLALSPYPFCFKAHAKARWLGQPLLEICVREFACVVEPTRAPTLDPRWSMPVYVTELCAGELWLHGRESESRASGRRLRAALIARWALEINPPHPCPPQNEITSDSNALRAPSRALPSFSPDPASDAFMNKRTEYERVSVHSRPATARERFDSAKAHAAAEVAPAGGLFQAMKGMDKGLNGPVEGSSVLQGINSNSTDPPPQQEKEKEKENNSHSMIHKVNPNIIITTTTDKSNNKLIQGKHKDLPSDDTHPIINNRDKPNHENEEATDLAEQWVETVRWLHTQPRALVQGLLRTELPVELPLQQKDILFHRLWRRESRLFAHFPLQVFRCDVAGPRSEDQLRLIGIEKPPGLAVHPSGAARKHSVTALLQEVLFGGPDAADYVYKECFVNKINTNPQLDSMEESALRQKNLGQPIEEEMRVHKGEGSIRGRGYVSFYHRTQGFELFRLWVAETGEISTNHFNTNGNHDGGLTNNLSPDIKNKNGTATTNSTNKAGVASAVANHPIWGLRPEDWALLRDYFTRARTRTAQSPTPTPSLASSSSTLRPPSGPWRPLVVHRLDAVTGGVLVLALDTASARQLARWMAERTESTTKEAETGCQKVYLARVHGMIHLQDKKLFLGNEFVQNKTRSTTPTAEAAAEEEKEKEKEEKTTNSQTPFGVRLLESNPPAEELLPSRLCFSTSGTSPLACETNSFEALPWTPSIRPSESNLNPPSPTLNRRQEKGWFVVERPVGCFRTHGPQGSLYWCANASQTSRWERREKRRLAALRVVGGQTRKGLRRKLSPAELAAKHARMRLLTCGVDWSEEEQGEYAGEEEEHRYPNNNRNNLNPFTVNNNRHGGAEKEEHRPHHQPSNPTETDHLNHPHAEADRKASERFIRSLRSASTAFTVLHRDEEKNETVVAAVLGTGRTHQIRVHLAALGHPIVGDVVYHNLSKRLGTTNIEEPAESVFDENEANKREKNPEAQDGQEEVEQQEEEESGGCLCPRRICLHAWRYRFGKTVMESPSLPDWAVSSQQNCIK